MPITVDFNTEALTSVGLSNNTLIVSPELLKTADNSVGGVGGTVDPNILNLNASEF